MRNEPPCFGGDIMFRSILAVLAVLVVITGDSFKELLSESDPYPMPEECKFEPRPSYCPPPPPNP